MRKILNKILIKIGLLVVKAPKRLITNNIIESKTLIAELLQKDTIKKPNQDPENQLFNIFSNSINTHKWHHYFQIYHQYFNPYLNRPIRLLEIGVFKGGSLSMWHNFFHQKSIIVGIDIDKKCSKYEDPENNIFVRIGNQTDSKFLKEIIQEFGPFDIILDDGSHKTHDQINSFNKLFKDGLTKKGCYLVEDCHTNYWSTHVNSPESFMEVAKYLIDLIHEPYLNRKEIDFRANHPNNLKELEISYLAANIDSIHFHDSIVVILKDKKVLPVSELL